MKNIILEKPYTKCGGETSPRSLYKKIKIEHISGSTIGNFIFLLYAQAEVYQNMLKN